MPPDTCTDQILIRTLCVASDDAAGITMDFAFDPTDGADVKYSYTPELRGPGTSFCRRNCMFTRNTLCGLHVVVRMDEPNAKYFSGQFVHSEMSLCCTLALS